MNRRSAIALLVHDPAGPGGVAQRAVGRHPIEGRRRAHPFAIAHLIEPKVLRILEEGEKRFAAEGQGGVGRAVTVLNPPGIPRGAFDQAIPVGGVEHGKVLKFRVRLEHAPRHVQQTEVLHVAPPTKILSFKEVFGPACGRRKQDEKGGRYARETKKVHGKLASNSPPESLNDLKEAKRKKARCQDQLQCCFNQGRFIGCGSHDRLVYHVSNRTSERLCANRNTIGKSTAIICFLAWAGPTKDGTRRFSSGRLFLGCSFPRWLASCFIC